MQTYTTSDITANGRTDKHRRNPFKEMEEAKDLDTLKRLWTEKIIAKKTICFRLKEKY